MVYYIVPVLFLLAFWCPWMAINVSIQYKLRTRGPAPPPVLRGEFEEDFVFELSGTHELHTINTTYQVATT